MLTLQMLRCLYTIEDQKPLVKDEEASDVDVHLYRSMIGSLMYLTASRPDIMFAVCACSRFQVTPKSSHLRKYNRRLSISWQRDSISWQCKKQTIMATSTTEAEYVAAASCCGQVLWIQNQIESLRRVFDGTEALLLPTLFILWLATVSTDSAKLVPLGKVCTAIETLKKNTAKALISLSTTITLSNTMVVLESCPKHNMVAYLEKTEGNAEFHEIIDFLTRSSIHHALTTDPSPRPSPSTTILDSIPESSGGNLRGHSSSDKSLSGNEGEMTLQSVYDLCISLCTQSMDEECLLEAKISKKEILKETMDATESCIQKREESLPQGELHHKDPLFDEIFEIHWHYILFQKSDPKDKGKKKIEEEDESESESDGIPEAEKKFKQLPSDEEMARKVQEEWEDEEERNRLAEEEATNNALIRNYNDIKARIKADRLLAEKLQEEEREQFIIEERAKFLHDTIAAQRKFLAQQRSEAIRNITNYKIQLKNQMMTT
ncbi:hypothetical protein Tco_1054239 [Tanacetum coccineum]|uniref:Uncharacterized protein n=1 Tax=Tanacetum coccineum TaxID=301880 RepID=A0ABQ5GYC2_9ASTR